MAEVFRFLMKLLYLSGFIIIYALFNLFSSSIAYFRKKNTPGNKDIFLSVICSLITIPILFTSYPLAIITWIGGLALYFTGAKENHKANNDSTPPFYFINLTIGVLIPVFLLLV